MLTPAFELHQDDKFLVVDIKAPYAKLSDIDVFFEDYEFKFYCKPYFLRLNLPGKVLYQEEPSVRYDVDKGIFTISMPKVCPGEHFDGLDLLTKLLAPKVQTSSVVPKIEVIGEVSYTETEEFDWETEQDPYEPDESLVSEAKCGFASQYSCSVFRLKEEAAEIFDFDTSNFPKSSALLSEKRSAVEASNFSEDHYLADLYEDEEILRLIKLQTEWEKLYHEKTKSSSSTDDCVDGVSFTSEEKERLRRLPNKEYLLEKYQIKSLLLGLIDIIFAYAYNKRITEGENTVESAWTINKLSATLSWMQVFHSVPSVVQSCVCRSLIYPLFRHWELSMKVLEDVKIILSLGRKYVLKCLLEIHELFCNSDPRYILNDLYITDYCVWIQGKSCHSVTLQKLGDALRKVQLSKADIGFELLELEHAARLAVKESEDSSSAVPDLCTQIASIKLDSGKSTKHITNNPEENVKVIPQSSSSEVSSESSSDSESSEESSESTETCDTDSDDDSSNSTDSGDSLLKLGKKNGSCERQR